MKKITAFLIFAALFVSFSPRALAANVDEYYEEQLEASGAADLADYLSEETRGYLEKIGCENIEFEKILNVSPSAVFELLRDFFIGGLNEPLKGLLKAVGAVLLISVCSGFFPDDEKSKSILNIICGCFIIIAVFAPAMQSIKAAASAVGGCAAFEKALIPVLAAVVTVSGNPTVAFSVQGASFAAAEFIESLAKSFAMPLIGAAGALGVTGAMLPTLRLSAISEIIRKTMTTVLAASAGLFSGFLTLKSLLSASADGLAVKGVKLAANTFIPVVGGAISEAYTSVIGSLSLLRTTVGIYAVIAFFAIGMPIVINLALWVLAMRVACAVSDLLDCRQCSEILRNIAFVFSTVNALLLLCMAVFIISAGLVVLMKSGE
ncbi:MAG: hypothetical protein IJ264_02620 [Clostridia bacterium]|nr:hypothetical protein [Clostridia bacterium]